MIYDKCKLQNCNRNRPISPSKNTPCQQLLSPLFERFGVDVYIKRDDLNHPLIQGNKLHKLKLNIKQAKLEGKSQLITYGGAYSNHIAATAQAAKLEGLESIGIIRGDELKDCPDKWSHTLRTAQANGMCLTFISRQAYREKDSLDAISQLIRQYPNAYQLPEGGSNTLAVAGFKSLIDEIQQQCPTWTHLFTAVGTGGTLAGLVKFAPVKQNRTILGVPALKQGEALQPQIEQWIGVGNTNTWQLLTSYHQGGYAKTPQELLSFMALFEQEFEILLDPIYTAKMIFAFYDQLQTNHIPRGSTIILLHTGGLQGRKQNTLA